MNHIKWIRIKSGMGILLPFGLLLLFVAGCGPSQKEMMAKDQMDAAKKAYAEARANRTWQPTRRWSCRKRARPSRSGEGEGTGRHSPDGLHRGEEDPVCRDRRGRQGGGEGDR